MSGRLLHSFYPIALVSLLALPGAVLAQTTLTGRTARGLIVEKIDDGRLRRIEGNTRSEANPQNDRGAVPDDLSMDHLLLQL